MKYIFLNLKRFDIPVDIGGVNNLFRIEEWGKRIIENIQEPIGKYANDCFVVFFPESHILGAKLALQPNGNLSLGCQSVHTDNIEKHVNFGAFTSSLPAAAASALGCSWTIIGHCEERKKIKEILREGNCRDFSAVNKVLGMSLKCALESGLNVLYCIGEEESEQMEKEQVLRDQLEVVPRCIDPERIVIAYEPVWAIGPGKTPPNADYITDVAGYIKSLVNCPVVYGGGLKSDNASMLATIASIDGGLIALTRFSGEIGFFPSDYVEIVKKYLER